jgi:bifunctional UDP-N-acetylglucosamine pyrophosphorylase / glucosamine-1-phosphate N-acetyltransferase
VVVDLHVYPVSPKQCWSAGSIVGAIMMSFEKVAQLQMRGVIIPNPHCVEIGPEVRIERISRGVTLHSGSKIFGSDTFIAENARIGYENPVTIENCYIGRNVSLNGGFFKQAVFLEGVKCGSGAHVREGTILEEYAGIAHTVGLKQTILFPYVTLGSLINFCDCLMSGGTGPRNHSEVGSSYIHFNFTPNQDKATPSLIGDVPRGVMIKQSPIFLGGQGGLVGPCRVVFGTVVAAGTILRKDQLQPDRLVFEGCGRSGSLPFKPGGYRNSKRILINNFIYLGNLLALGQWYRNIRALFVGPDFPPELLEGLLRILDMALDERIKQLKILNEKMSAAVPSGGVQQQFLRCWPRLEDRIREQRTRHVSDANLDAFLGYIDVRKQACGNSYLNALQGLTEKEADSGVGWLKHAVRQLLDQVEVELIELKLSKVWDNE